MTHPIASGLAVRAKDTGRVLYLQRGFSDQTDPARGKIELPGGHIDPGETPLEAARREWGEEVGTVPPKSAVVNTWRSGVYRGFIVDIDRESQLKVNKPHKDRKRINPDDPDGDEIETSMWLSAEDVKKNPMIRQELKDSMWKYQRALRTTMGSDKKYEMRLESMQMRRGEQAKAAGYGSAALLGALGGGGLGGIAGYVGGQEGARAGYSAGGQSGMQTTQDVLNATGNPVPESSNPLLHDVMRSRYGPNEAPGPGLGGNATVYGAAAGAGVGAVGGLLGEFVRRLKAKKIQKVAGLIRQRFSEVADKKSRSSKSAAMPVNEPITIELVVKRAAIIRGQRKVADLSSVDRKALADKLLNMNSVKGRLADYLTVGWGGERAGRAQQLAEASGNKASVNVRHPTTVSALSSLFGAGAGGVTGGALGLGLGSLVGPMMENPDQGNQLRTLSTLVGTGGGAVAGGLLASLLASKLRRNEMRGIRDQYIAEGGEPQRPEFSNMATYLAPLRGPHRTGQAQAYRAMSGETDGLEDRSHLHDLGYIAPALSEFAVPGTELPVQLGVGFLQNKAAVDAVS